MGQNLKTQIATIFKNSNSWKNSISDKKSFGLDNLTPRQRMRCTWGSLLLSCNVLGWLSLSKCPKRQAKLLWFEIMLYYHSIYVYNICYFSCFNFTKNPSWEDFVICLVILLGPNQTPESKACFMVFIILAILNIGTGNKNAILGSDFSFSSRTSDLVMKWKEVEQGGWSGSLPIYII